MVLVRPTVVFGILKTAIPPRWDLAVYGMQIVEKGGVKWAEKAAWFRNVPYTAIDPTEGQMEVRIYFGELAKQAKGKKGLVVSERLGKELPPAAALIADRMVGFRAPHAKPPELYPSKLRRTKFTLEDLKAKLRAKGITPPVA